MALASCTAIVSAGVQTHVLCSQHLRHRGPAADKQLISQESPQLFRELSALWPDAAAAQPARISQAYEDR